MKWVKVFIFMALIIPNSCKTQEVSDNGLPPMIFYNFEAASRYLIENIKNNEIDYNIILSNLHEQFGNNKTPRLMGFNWAQGFILADLDKDGIYELYFNASAGSGFVHFFLHGYNPVTNEYYTLSKRMQTDYLFFIHKGEIYVLANQDWYWKNQTEIKNIKIYRPILKNGELNLEDIEENIHQTIIELIVLDNIYRPFSGNVFRD